MFHAGIQSYLPRQRRPRQDLFRLVAQLRGEDAVGLRRRDGQRAGDGREFVFGDEGRVRKVPDFDAALEMPGNVLREETQVLDFPWVA